MSLIGQEVYNQGALIGTIESVEPDGRLRLQLPEGGTFSIQDPTGFPGWRIGDGECPDLGTAYTKVKGLTHVK